MHANPTEHPRPGQLAVMLRALGHRNYRLFFIGQSVSVLGTWMQQIAMSWLVFHLTRSAFMLGVVGFAESLPLLLLGPFAGVWADRWDRRRTLLVTQALLMLQALLLGALALAGVIAVWHILLLGALAGFVTALDGAMRSAFLPEMVEERGDLGSAIALSSFIQHGARMLGPPLAGALIAWLASQGGVEEGTGVCFVVNGLSYLAVCAALGAMHVETITPRQGPHGSVLTDFRDGLAYAVRERAIRDLLLVQVLVTLTGVPYALMPLVARDMLHGGPDTLGFSMGCMGLGAMTGAAFLASRRGVAGTLDRVGWVGIASGLSLVGFSFTGELWLSLALLTVIGFTMMVIVVSAYTLLQTVVAEDKRGRVVCLYLLAAWGLTPLGSLLMGSLAQWAGIATAYLVSGVCSLAGFLWFAARLPVLRPLVETVR